ncbi:hypothetical protein Glove_465g57 [Diversispora epigaea]|uniref:Uncharacterized protein n=1 Tax=Diversispora epigaea TaxID=1348612 RepID=A0A397GLZ1_9GLOM|nr:hypothetical protein Glove_465g57 [Diversispora epigaea]
MVFISRHEFSENGLSYVLCASPSDKGKFVSANEALKTNPEVVELYEKLNNNNNNNNIFTYDDDNHNDTFSMKNTFSMKMPHYYKSMIENCLEENHYVATFDLIEAFQTKNYHPVEEQIRRLMDIIVNDQVENMEIITGAYRVLQHILQTSGTTAFQKIWEIDHVDPEQKPGPLWNEYTDFWNFIEQLIPHQLSTDKVETVKKVERVERIVMLLDHIVGVFETDIQLKKGNLGNSILLSLIPKGYGRLRTNIKGLVQTLTSAFHVNNISIEIIRIFQRLLGQIILLSLSGHICPDSLKTELYIQINKLDPFQFQLFLQTMTSNTFKCKLLDHALKDTNLTQISRQNKNSLNCPVDLLKITQIYFDSSPYYKISTKSSATWRHIFILCSLLQSYIQSKILRVGDKIYSGLDDDEINLINNSNEINERINELVDSLNEDEDINPDLKKRTKFLLDLLKIDVNRLKELDTQ